MGLFASRRRKETGEADPADALWRAGQRKLDREQRAALAALIAERDMLRRHLAEAEALADRDGLTGAINRRAFMRELHRALAAAERYGTPSAVLYIDLDAFKQINDRFGHAAGDAVLAHVARVLRDQVRETDVVGRIGGDEFAVILNHATLDDGKVKARALQDALRANPLVFQDVKHRVDASIGVHACARSEDAETALARADEAMYAAKWLSKRTD
ncbi:MAG: diguanylate cyclase [Alphaproteobacteria bacterium]|nr:diguanylate cyclase [Alphaproteobacteria bacterium]